MSRGTLESRVACLEGQLAKLQAKVDGETTKSWLESIYGAFANDPIYDEAMRLGREYRESLRPKASQKRGVKKQDGHSRHRSGRQGHRQNRLGSS
jgi:hypothetical protein